MTDQPINEATLVQFLARPDLVGIDLGPFKPKPTALSGDPIEAALQLYASSDGKMKIGIWECSEGRFSASRDTSSETCFIISGHVALHGPDGMSKEFKSGDMLVLPRGWHGEWSIIERTRKIYVLYADK